MSMSGEARVGDLLLFGLVQARFECGSAAFRSESLWLSVTLLQSEAMPLRRSLETNQLLRERHSLSERNAAEPPGFTASGPMGFALLVFELWTLDFGLAVSRLKSISPPDGAR
jgi:hypothetical protein